MREFIDIPTECAKCGFEDYKNQGGLSGPVYRGARLLGPRTATTECLVYRCKRCGAEEVTKVKAHV